MTRHFWLVQQYDIDHDTFKTTWHESPERPNFPGALVCDFPVVIVPGERPEDVIPKLEIRTR